MNRKELIELNGEHLLHTVWIEHEGRVSGIADQTIEDIAEWIQEQNVVKITCQGFTREAKIREVDRWGS
jgi:hypothetical protein